MAFDIPYIKLQFHLEMFEDTILPSDKVSALRGGMGEMLLLQNCVRDRDCDHCAFQKDCVVWDTLYSRMEERPDYVTGKESVGYLIECRDRFTQFKAGSELQFQLTLFGSGIAFFNLYLQAFTYLGMVGLGKYQSKFRVREVQNTQGYRILDNGVVDMSEYRIGNLADYVARRKERLLGGDGAYTMMFLSPLSMKSHGEYLNSFDGEALVKGAARRAQMLDYYVGNGAPQPEFAEYPVISKQRVKDVDTKRYSSTQGSKIRLPGIQGDILFETMPEDCLEYLIAGELTHIGKNTSFGFGHYKLARGG